MEKRIVVLTLSLRRAVAALSVTSLIAIGMILGTATSASAATLSVPGTYSTISAAVAAAASGDVITVAAGTYVEDVTVPAGKSLTITGVGPATTTITGRLTLNAPTTVSGFTLQGQAGAPYTQDPIWITATGAGSIVESNTIQNGYRGVYISGVVGTASVHTIIRNNAIKEAGFGNTGAVWIASSTFVDVINNHFANTTIDGVGVNMVAGSSNIVITGNSFTNFGNVIVLIANSIGFPATPQAHDILISDNTIAGTTGTAFYIGGNNMIDVTITGNTFTGVPATATAILITPGYGEVPTQWLEPGNRPLERWIIKGNSIDGAGYGVRVLAGAQLDKDTTVQIIQNKFCTVAIAAIQNTDITSVLAIDNDFCKGAVLGNVVVRNTPPVVPAAQSPSLAATGIDSVMAMGLVSGGGASLLLGMLLLLVKRRRVRAALNTNVG